MRIRTIKPEFWTDATMVQMDPLARLLFIGLWNVADDHGYMQDEPDRIAMLVLPKEATERVEELIDLLIAADRVERIEDETGSVLRIKNWERHQRVDKPSVSKLARGGRKQTIPDAVRRAVATKYGCKPGGEARAKCYHCGAEGSIKWWKNRTGGASFWVSFSGLQLDHLEAEANGGETAAPNIVLACRSCNAGKKNNHAFSLALANFREDSRKPRESSLLEGKGKEEEGKGSMRGAHESDALGEAWNEITTSPLPRVTLPLAKSRRQPAIEALARRPIDDWCKVFRLVNASSYCRGSKGWMADFDWIIRAEGKKPEPAAKVLEGSYADTGPPGRSSFVGIGEITATEGSL